MMGFVIQLIITIFDPSKKIKLKVCAHLRRLIPEENDVTYSLILQLFFS